MFPLLWSPAGTPFISSQQLNHLTCVYLGPLRWRRSGAGGGGKKGQGEEEEGEEMMMIVSRCCSITFYLEIKIKVMLQQEKKGRKEDSV